MASRGDINYRQVQPSLFKQWDKLKFDHAINKSGSFTKLTSKKYQNNGKFPVIDQGENSIAGFVDDENLLYKGSLPIIVFGDHTRNFKYIDFPFAVGADGTKILTPIKAFDEKFFYYYLRSLTIPSLGYSRHFSILKGIEIPLPPLAEQKRIVCKLDEAFQHLETLKAKLERIPKLLKKFRETVLTHAVTGKLTEKWRADNSLKFSKDILEEIKKRTKEAKKVVFFEDVEDRPFEIPSQWTFTYLGALSEKITYGTSAKSENEGTTPVIRMGNLQKGKIDWHDLKFTSDPDELKKYKLAKGDVLFNRTNSPELVGKTSIFEDDRPAIYAGYLMKIWNYPELNSSYLNYLLNTPYARQWCWEVKTDGVSQSNINAQKLLNFVVPFPSLEEQLQIVEIVDDLLSKAEVIETHYSSLKLKIDSVPQALLVKAFQGKLVQQDENDEPASVLLEKIKNLNRTLSHENKKTMDIKV